MDAKSTGLAFVFMAAADIALAGGLGMIGVHGAVVDGGVAMGDALGIPQLDWFDLWENGEFSFLDPETDPCLSQPGGHWHGDVCHVSGGGSSGELLSQNLTSSEPSESLTFEN